MTLDAVLRDLERRRLDAERMNATALGCLRPRHRA